MTSQLNSALCDYYMKKTFEWLNSPSIFDKIREEEIKKEGKLRKMGYKKVKRYLFFGKYVWIERKK